MERTCLQEDALESIDKVSPTRYKVKNLEQRMYNSVQQIALQGENYIHEKQQTDLPLKKKKKKFQNTCSI